MNGTNGYGRTVWKYTLEADKTLTLQIGGDPKVVLVDVDPHNPDGYLPSVWVEHDPGASTYDTIQIRFFGTGMRLPNGWRHVGSKVMTGYGLVWHVYAVTS